MADEPDNVLLRLMREVRSKLDEHDGRFDKLDQRMEEVHETMYTVAGMSAHSNVRHDTVAEKLNELENRLKKLEEKA